MKLVTIHQEKGLTKLQAVYDNDENALLIIHNGSGEAERVLAKISAVEELYNACVLAVARLRENDELDAAQIVTAALLKAAPEIS